MPSRSHEDYFKTMPPDVRLRLEQIQAEVEKRVRGATRCISYGMPAFKQGRTFFYFAGFKKHVGVYPPIKKDKALIIKTSRFRGPKGNLSFPHDEALPVKLIGRIAVALANEYR